MSLLWPEAYIAVLGPQSVGLYRCRGRQWLGSADFEAVGGVVWPAAVAALESLLTQREPGRAVLRVVLSSHYTRFCLVPWSAQISRLEELDAYARLCFEDIYGAMGEGWRLRLSPESAGCSRLASALSAELLDQLRSLAKACDMRLTSVQPYLMAAFNRYRPAVTEDNFLFLVAEHGRGSLLLATDGQWSRVRSVVFGERPGALGDLIAREAELQELERQVPTAFYLHEPGYVGPVAANVTCLDSELPSGQGTDPLLAMAMAMAMTVN